VKVFVTGATGFVGQELLHRLHDAGHSARILARDAKSRRVREAATRWHTEVHQGNILDAASMEGGLNGVDAVVPEHDAQALTATLKQLFKES